MKLPVRPETKHSLLLVASTGFTALVSFVYSVYAMSILGPEAAADFMTAMAVATFCFIALGPINGTVAKFAAEFAVRDDWNSIATLQRVATWKVGVIGGAGCVIGCLLAQPISVWLRFDSALPLVVAFVMVWLTLLLSVARGVLRGTQRFGQYSLNIITESVVRLIAGIGLLSIIRSATGGLLAFVVGLLVILIVSRVQLADLWRLRQPSDINHQAINRYLKPMCVMMAVTAAFANIDMMLVKRFFDSHDAGIYGAAFALARGMSVLVTPFGILILPLVAGLQERGRPVRQTIVRICGYFVALSAVPLVVFAVWPTRVLSLVLLDGYIEAAPLLFPLTAARLLGHLNGLIALSHASLSRFGFLRVILPALIVEIALLALFHDTRMTVILIVLIVQVVTFVALVAHSMLPRTPRNTEDRRPA
ncbi:MAG: oligosaccharide flippase family protein [Planctomycetes bacterium]|nr:oligosaccharide flippase family protein [Planctomycetota bacterium]